MLFLKINELNEYAYEHFFEIDDLKKSYYKYTQLHQTVEKCEHIEKVDKRKINILIKEFKSLCKKIIKRDEDFDIEKYIFYMQSLVVINSKIQKILTARKYRKHKEISNLEIEYNKVNNYLSYATSSFEVIINNHYTFVGIILIFAMLIGGFIFFIATENIVGTLLDFLFLVILLILYFLLGKKIMHSFYIDRINRIISKNTYIKSLKMKKANKYLKYILKSNK